MNNKNHIAKLRPDKFLGDEYFRHLFIGHEKNGQSEHEYREVQYFPADIFVVEDDGGEKIYFVPIILVRDKPEIKESTPCSEKKPVPVPIFMLDLKRARIEEVKKFAKTKDMIISDKYFRKPIMAMCYDERIEKGLEMDEETIERIEIRTTRIKRYHRHPYDGSSFNHMH